MTNEELLALDGTQGSEYLYLTKTNTFIKKHDFDYSKSLFDAGEKGEAERELSPFMGRREFNQFIKEWKPTHIESWTFEVSNNRFGQLAAYRKNSETVEV